MSKGFEAVVEIYRLENFDVWNSTKDTKPFIRLSKDTTFNETGSVIARIAGYVRIDVQQPAEQIIKELINKKNLVVAGGLRVFDEEKEIYPGCCCGLERWEEWLHLSPESISIWLGHDPTPFIEFLPKKQIYRIWSDYKRDRNNKKKEHTFHIDFSVDELRTALENVTQDLRNFTIVLKNWADEIVPDQSDELIKTFKAHFHIE